MEFTPDTLNTLIGGELKDALAANPEPADKEQKKQRRQQKKQIKELEKHRDKLGEYDSRLVQIGGRNSMSKTDPDATFMRMKEDAMNNGRIKPDITCRSPPRISSSPTSPCSQSHRHTHSDTVLQLIPRPLRASALCGRRRLRLWLEENYRFMDEAGMEAYVKYNRFHIEQRPRYKPNPFHHDNFHYNADEDYYVCPMGST